MPTLRSLPTRRGAVAMTAAVATLSLIGGAAASTASASPSTGKHAVPKPVIGKSKYGKWVKMGVYRSKCRVQLSIAAGNTVSGGAEGYCKKKSQQAVVGRIYFDASGKYKDIKKLGTGKYVGVGGGEMKNPKGKQKMCIVGYTQSPWDGGEPWRRSEAKVCITY
ncbi:hypothetical protein [Streptomyces sp. NPDC059009]|uniref:hypothetical protein n=1 Tax=Streptomyces sp. NPDC059009 TaxID=3346694 RepID=UPI0036C355B8